LVGAGGDWGRAPTTPAGPVALGADVGGAGYGLLQHSPLAHSSRPLSPLPPSPSCPFVYRCLAYPPASITSDDQQRDLPVIHPPGPAPREGGQPTAVPCPKYPDQLGHQAEPVTARAPKTRQGMGMNGPLSTRPGVCASLFISSPLASPRLTSTHRLFFAGSPLPRKDVRHVPGQVSVANPVRPVQPVYFVPPVRFEPAPGLGRACLQFSSIPLTRALAI
jgi:hypothetical protein